MDFRASSTSAHQSVRSVGYGSGEVGDVRGVNPDRKVLRALEVKWLSRMVMLHSLIGAGVGYDVGAGGGGGGRVCAAGKGRVRRKASSRASFLASARLKPPSMKIA